MQNKCLGITFLVYLLLSLISLSTSSALNSLHKNGILNTRFQHLKDIHQLRFFRSPRNPTSSNPNPLAYTILDIVKIFGRLSDKCIIGHGLFDKNGYALSKRDSQRYKKWESLFENSNSISRTKFQEIVPSLKFRWPVTANSGQLSNKELVDVPVAPQVFISVCKDFQAHINRAQFNSKEFNKFLESQPISTQSLDSVFTSLADETNYIKKSHFISLIKARAPCDGIIDWPTFIYFLDCYPQEDILRFFD